MGSIVAGEMLDDPELGIIQFDAGLSKISFFSIYKWSHFPSWSYQMFYFSLDDNLDSDYPPFLALCI